MTLRISRALHAQILRHARESPGAEVCGLLTGSHDAILGVVPAANVAADPATRFEIDPATLFAAIRAQRAGGPRVIGHYHSHPRGRAAPSPRDAADAAGAPALWLLVAGDDVTAWRSGDPRGIHACFRRVELVVECGCEVA